MRIKADVQSGVSGVNGASLPSSWDRCLSFRFTFAFHRLLGCRYLLTVPTFGMKPLSFGVHKVEARALRSLASVCDSVRIHVVRGCVLKSEPSRQCSCIAGIHPSCRLSVRSMNSRSRADNVVVWLVSSVSSSSFSGKYNHVPHLSVYRASPGKPTWYRSSPTSETSIAPSLVTSAAQSLQIGYRGSPGKPT